MKKTNIIKKNFDISKVLDSKKGYRNRYFNVYYNENNVGKHRFAVCVSKKIGNAVTRNKVKRQVKDVIDKSNLDDELIIRWCQASALLPMIQFSLDVWNRKQNRVAEICKKTVALREKFTPYLLEKLREAAKNGVPAVRYMAYEFPNCGFERVVNQFMLGEKYLVAPVLEKGATCREIVFPDGKWKDIYDGKVYEGGAFMVPAPIDKLPVFEKIG